MDQACEAFDTNSTLAATSTSDAPTLPKTLLDLPDDLLLPILALTPFNRKSLQSLRLTCRRFNDLTHTKALYREVSRIQFFDISPLFFIKLEEANLRHTELLQRELDEIVGHMISNTPCGPKKITTLHESLVKKGIALILWVIHHAANSPDSLSAGNTLLDLARDQLLDFAALLTIRMTAVILFNDIETAEKRQIIKYNRDEYSFVFGPRDGQDSIRLFLAFESAILWTKQIPTRSPASLRICSHSYMQDAFGAMIDSSGLAALHLKNNRDNALSAAEPWTIFPALLKEKAASDQHLMQLLGSDFGILTDMEQYHRIKDLMEQSTLAEEVLKCLDLNEIGRSTPLRGRAFGFPRLWWRWNP